MTPSGPVDRVRARLARELPTAELDLLPRGYQRLGSVLVVKLPERLRPHFAAIGRAYRDEMGVATVLRRGPISGEFRVPKMERLAGNTSETETREHGIVYRFDAARLMFAAGNRSERVRLPGLVAPGEMIADLFAGIGYFTLPLAVHSRARRIVACEANPVSFEYLRQNLRRNGVEGKVEALLGPNETATLRAGSFDRVVLGYLPSALPWIDRALPLLTPAGGWLHVHVVIGTQDGLAAAEGAVRSSIARAGGTSLEASAREVKPYGPGKLHAVVDVRARPP